MPKYENAVVYKLCCDDPEITDIYVGSTCNFKVRKNKHKSACTNENAVNHNLYVYQFIRENGGWDAWSMILVKKYPHVVDNQELLKKERKWITRLKATLNKIMPTRTGKEWKMDNKEHVKQYNDQYRIENTKHIKQYNDQYRKLNRNKINEKIPCDCGCLISRSNLVRHKNSKKHKEYMSNK
jgi:hypothetical protein